MIDDDISARLGKVSASFGRLTKRLWNERGMCTKFNMCCAVVLTTLLYGCEVWTPYRRHIRRLDQFHMRCLRQIAGIKWQDMLPNTEVLEQCGTWRIEFHIKREQLRWSGPQVRMNDDRIPKPLFYGKPKTGCRTRGGQRKRYKGVIKATLKSCSIPLNTWETTATNRPLCRHTCHNGQQDFEQKRLQIIKDRRTQRKNGQPPQGPATTYDCTICGRQCASRIGLHSHQRKHN